MKEFILRFVSICVVYALGVLFLVSAAVEVNYDAPYAKLIGSLCVFLGVLLVVMGVYATIKEIQDIRANLKK